MSSHLQTRFCLSHVLPRSCTDVPQKGTDVYADPNNEGECCAGLQISTEARPTNHTAYCPLTDPGHGEACWSTWNICRAVKGCDAAKAGQCTKDAQKDFPAAMTAQSKERCEDIVRTYMDCVTEDCASVISVSDLKKEFEEGCAQLEGSGSGSASMRARCNLLLCQRPRISLPHVF